MRCSKNRQSDTKIFMTGRAQGCHFCPGCGLSPRLGPDRRRPDSALRRLGCGRRGGSESLSGRCGPVASIRGPEFPRAWIIQTARYEGIERASGAPAWCTSSAPPAKRRCCTASRAGPMGQSICRGDARLGRQSLWHQYRLRPSGGGGVVYKLNPAGNYTVLYGFAAGAGGSTPFSGVIRDSAGNLYGTTSVGCTTGGAWSISSLWRNGATAQQTLAQRGGVHALSSGRPSGQCSCVLNNAEAVHGNTGFIVTILCGLVTVKIREVASRGRPLDAPRGGLTRFSQRIRKCLGACVDNFVAAQSLRVQSSSRNLHKPPASV